MFEIIPDTIDLAVVAIRSGPQTTKKNFGPILGFVTTNTPCDYFNCGGSHRPVRWVEVGRPWMLRLIVEPQFTNPQMKPTYFIKVLLWNSQCAGDWFLINLHEGQIEEDQNAKQNGRWRRYGEECKGELVPAGAMRVTRQDSLRKDYLPILYLSGCHFIRSREKLRERLWLYRT